LLINARSIYKKLDELRILTTNVRPGCIAITETWLSDDITNECLTLEGYVLLRSDRSGRQGGGVCLYVQNKFNPELASHQLIDHGTESLSVRLNSINMVITSVYIPPNLTAGQHENIFESLTNLFDATMTDRPDTKFLICGDFNDFSTAAFGQSFLCVNRVSLPTRGNSYLDQIWLSESIEVHYPNCAEIGPPLGTSDHNCVLLRPTEELLSDGKEVTRTILDYRREHIHSFLIKLSNLGFSEVYSAPNANEKCAAFYSAFYDAMSEIPQHTVTFSSRDKQWITPILKKLIQDRWSAYRAKNWPVYYHLKQKVKTEIQRAKRTWSDKILSRDKNPWNIVRDIQGKKLKPQTLLETSNQISFLTSLTAFFQTHFNDTEDADICTLPDQQWNMTIDPLTVHKLLRSLKLKQSPGHDGVTARLLKDAADLIYMPLTDIFQASIDTRCFPDFWKFGIVCPIPKVNKPKITDFRPITLLPIISKLFEKIVLLSMKKTLIACFGQNQHAFRPLGSSTSALVDIHDTITTYMEDPKNIGVRVTCLDFAKAFDKIQHHRLINHLFNVEVLNNGFLLWLRSYLEGRLQRVKVNERLGMGTLIQVRSGVPQGSVLGPYLFAIFIGTLHIDAPNAKLVKFADDITLIESVSAGHDNMSLSTVLTWTTENNMEVNLRKCQQMLIHRSRSTGTLVSAYSSITVSSTIKILGVTFNKHLTWSDHFNTTLLSASRRLHTSYITLS